MNHKFEVFVDTVEYNGTQSSTATLSEARYEIDADSRLQAYSSARTKAEHEHPSATEYCIRVTRVLH